MIAPPPESEPLRMMAVPVTASSAGVTFGPAVKVFEGHYFPTWPTRGYDVTRDGQRLLMVQMDRKPLTAVREIVLVQNWTRELQERVRGR